MVVATARLCEVGYGILAAMQKAVAAIVALGFIGFVVWLFVVYGGSAQTSTVVQTSETPLAKTHYQCDAAKTIDAEYYNDSGARAANQPNEPPTPAGRVAIRLSDGRSATLPQTISASGIRYANADESMIFWSKGNGAFLIENNRQTYAGCIKIADDPGGLPQVFESGSQGFSIRYPAGYTVDTSYKYQALGPGKDIGGIRFTIASSTAGGTNLSNDTYFSVEEMPQNPICSANLFLDGGSKLKTTKVTIDGIDYSVASITGAAAGNRYEETVYALSGTNPCIAVRYFIHYGVIDNYPPGKVKEFDEQALVQQFDAMRKTLIMQQ